MARQTELLPEIYAVDTNGVAWPTSISNVTKYRDVNRQEIRIEKPQSKEVIGLIVKTSVGDKKLHFVKEGVYVSVPAGNAPCANFLIEFQKDALGGYTYYKFNCPFRTTSSLVLHYEEDSRKKPRVATEADH
jgi:hypothetical protein